jgi:hypothetical protein
MYAAQARSPRPSVAGRSSLVQTDGLLPPSPPAEKATQRDCNPHFQSGENPHRGLGYTVANIRGKVVSYVSSIVMRMRTSFDEWLWSKVLQRQASPFWRRVGRWLNRPYANAFPVTSPRR